MSAIEQKFISLFSPLPFSVKAKIVALLSQHLAEEAKEEEGLHLDEDLATANQVRQLIDEGKMKTISEEEYWNKLKAKGA
ncbi:MAG: hypothetical protein AAFQ87_16855 [Bacteroidota bacterium]